MNEVAAGHYQGWSARLTGCEADALAMYETARGCGLDAQMLLTAAATVERVAEVITGAAARAESGDLFVLTYSGSGGQVPDTNGGYLDHVDDTWALYDRQLVDDELYALLGRFVTGVRILVLSDTCHSGSVMRGFDVVMPAIVTYGVTDTPAARTKEVPGDVTKRTYEANHELYDSVQNEMPPSETIDLRASVIVLGACQPNQLALDGDTNGLFTRQVGEVWHDGRWQGSHRRFHVAIAARMPPTQRPIYSTLGPRNVAFEQQTPFCI